MEWVHILGLIFAITTLILLVYKGFNPIVSAIISVLVAGLTNGFGVWETLSKYFVPGFTSFFGSVMFIFIFASIYGKMMGASGSASAIAYKLIDIFGGKNVVLIIGMTTALLVYGGVSVFVVIFSVLPISLILLKEADIPKILLPAIIAWGQETFAMTALPGSPQLNNILPTEKLGTTPMAGPVLGLVAALIMIFGGYFYLNAQVKKLKSKGLHFDVSTLRESDRKEIRREDCPSALKAFAPLITLFAIYLSLDNGFIFNINMSTFDAVNTAMAFAILLIFILNLDRKEELKKAFVEGSTEWIVPLVNLSVIIAFGTVVKNTQGFESFVQFSNTLGGSVYVQAAVVVNILAGITGSSSGGMTIAINSMADRWLALGANPQVLHRICNVASTGLDSLPHCGGLNINFNICNEKLKYGYKYAFFVAGFMPIVATVVIVILANFGVV